MSKENKEVILLCSPANSGKTTSIVGVYNQLVTKYKMTNQYPIQQPIKTNPDVYKDIDRISFTIKNTVIGFCSSGDIKAITQQNISFFKKNKCEICITASRTRGKTKTLITDWVAENGYHLSIIDFASATNNHANSQKVQMIMDRLKIYGI